MISKNKLKCLKEIAEDQGVSLKYIIDKIIRNYLKGYKCQDCCHDDNKCIKKE
jgi:hypothetical protein